MIRDVKRWKNKERKKERRKERKGREPMYKPKNTTGILNPD
jgi:hypothetical protein